jgi:hypothetical protein
MGKAAHCQRGALFPIIENNISLIGWFDLRRLVVLTAEKVAYLIPRTVNLYKSSDC